MMYLYSDLADRLKRRAEIRRQIQTRRSVQEGQPDRLSDLLEEAASAIECLHIRLDQEMSMRLWYEKRFAPEVQSDEHSAPTREDFGSNPKRCAKE